MANVVSLAHYRPFLANVSACVAPNENAAILNFERRQVVVKSNELLMLERCIANLKRGQNKQDAQAVWEWRDEIEVIALHTEILDIREQCFAALQNDKHITN